jgi:hypothetical protein
MNCRNNKKFLPRVSVCLYNSGEGFIAHENHLIPQRREKLDKSGHGVEMLSSEMSAMRAKT